MSPDSKSGGINTAFSISKIVKSKNVESHEA